MRRYLSIFLAAVICLLMANDGFAISYILSKTPANWTDTTAWTVNNGLYPGIDDGAFIRGNRIATINSDVGVVSNFFIGEATAGGTINITAGGKLVTTTSSYVGRPQVADNGIYVCSLLLTSGTLQVGTNSEALLQIGVDVSTTARGTGRFTINGGTFNGRLLVGSAIAGDTGDIVRIEGSSATIGTASTTGNALEVRASGTLEFIFDATGISPMTYEGTVTFAPGSSIIVNGAAYTGGARTFNLITAGTLGEKNCTVVLTNFAGEASAVWDSLDGVFRVTTGAVAEPANSVILDENNSLWSNPAAWNGNVLPGAANTAYIRSNFTVTVNSAVPAVTGVIIGNVADTGTVNVVTGGTLTATGNIQLGRSSNNGAKGILNLSGGTLQIADTGRLIIGLDGTGTHATGLLNLSSGTFDGRLLVGSDVVGNSGDIARINGSKATVGSASSAGNALEVRGSGTLEFVFDASGISTMTYAGTVAFSRGSSIVVDGAAYTGGAGTFNLISAGTLLDAKNVAISLINFAAGTSCKWTNGVLRLTVAGPAPAFPEFIRESARSVPVAASVDVVVVGGSSGAVAAAVAAAQGGASVYLLAPRTYLGEDLCGTFRLYLENGEVPQSALAKKIFTGPAADSSPLTVTPVESAGGFTRVVPHYAKVAMDSALLSNNVQFIYGVYPSDVLRDSGGRIAGVVIANRSGRQAIRAHTVIDATPHAVVARLAGAAFSDYPSGTQTFTRIVIGSDAKAAGGVIAGSRAILPPYDPTFRHAKASAELNELGTKYPMIEYTLNLPMSDGSFRSFSQAEQIARDFTCAYSDENEADYLFQVPPDQMTGAASETGSWPGAAQISLDAFRPAGQDGLYVLGGCADLSRPQAAALLRPLNLMDVGARIGSAAAAAGSVDSGKTIEVDSAVASSDGSELGDIRETLKGLRSTSSGLPVVRQSQRGLPVLGKYDVVVVGGGTSGAPAGIAAARQGKRTLVLEYQNALGGVGTMGMIFGYHGSSGTGFAVEISAASAKLPDEPPGTPVATWKGNARTEWLRRQIRVAGGDVWFSTIGCGAVVQNGRVTGVVVVTPEGRGVILADAVIDATGNSDIAVAAGAAYQYIDSRQFAMQDAGISFREMPWRHINSGYTITDEADVIDVSHMYMYSRLPSVINNVFDLGTFINTRERQRIVGDYTLDVTDVMAGQTFPDTVSQYRANLDTHGYLIHPFFNLAEMPPSGSGFDGNVPYRCLLPQGLEGILTVGLGVSAHRDAMPFVRMQPSLINVGYAAGVAAAMAVNGQVGLRDIDIRQLQQHLVNIGNLTPEVLTDGNSFPFSDAALNAAIGSFTNDLTSCAIVLSAGSRAVAPLKAAFNQSSGRKKERCAVALALLGDTSGVDTLIARLNSATNWDLGWSYQSVKDENNEVERTGSFVSEIDGIVRALGVAGDRKAVPAISRLALMLDPSGEYSHYHSVAYALSLMPSAEGADTLYSLLTMPKMTGWNLPTFARMKSPGTLPATVVLREASPREVMLASALYRNGDKNGLGRQILENYSQDLRGTYGRFVSQVLIKNHGFFFSLTGR